MRKIRQIAKSVFLPLFGLFFAFLMIFPSTPVMADEPNQSAPSTSQTTSNNTSTDTNNETCYTQLGGISWLLCPVISVSANAIDAIYGIIADILKVNPSVTSNTESPIYVVWEYVRNITNIIFIILLLISIYSQITGLGISNYGIKRVLPRIIISALLVNLSFIICALAVDVSNILGVSIYGFFESVRDSTIGTSTTNVQIDPGQGLLSFLGIGAIAGTGIAIGSAIAGGFGALFFAAIPVVLAGLLAIIVALITVMLRQGVIALLIMIAPLAFVAYLLPNTEKWFNKWRDILIRMLIFYPLFAILFGATNLAGWAIMTSANGDAFWALVGFAVQIIPLFLCWSLMKMSGTILGTVSNKLSQLTRPATTNVKTWSDSHRQLHRSRYLGEPAKNYQIPRRVRQKLAENRNTREVRAATYQTLQKSRQETTLQQLIVDQSTRKGKQLLAAKDAISDTTSVNRQLQLQEVSDRYRRSHDAILRNTKGEITERYTAMKKAAGTSGQQGINAIVSGAISSQAKVAKEALGDYESLYENAIFSSEIYDELEAAFSSKNPIAMRAALSVLAQRGEYDTIERMLRKHTPNIKTDSPEDRAMQQAIADVMFTIKVADPLKGYGKSIAKSRNKANIMNRNRADNDQLPTFFDFVEYEHPESITDANRRDALVKVLQTNLETILRTNNNADVAAIQDKTMWDDAKDHNVRLFTPDQLRHAIFDKPTNGETYQCMIDAQLGGGAKWQDKTTRRILTFRAITANPAEHVAARSSTEALNEARQQVINIMSGINASQLAKFTPDAFEAFTTIFSQSSTINTDGTITFDNSNEVARRQNLIDGLTTLSQYFPEKLTSDLRKQNQRGNLSNMNPEIREILDEVLHFEPPQQT